jgi:hypothetical protein
MVVLFFLRKILFYRLVLRIGEQSRKISYGFCCAFEVVIVSSKVVGS